MTYLLERDSIQVSEKKKEDLQGGSKSGREYQPQVDENNVAVEQACMGSACSLLLPCLKLGHRQARMASFRNLERKE